MYKLKLCKELSVKMNGMLKSFKSIIKYYLYYKFNDS